jgi:hypothetical protein
VFIVIRIILDMYYTSGGRCTLTFGSVMILLYGYHSITILSTVVRTLSVVVLFSLENYELFALSQLSS